MDLWAIARKRLLGIPAPNYGLVGRWLGHMRHGRFRHDSIASAPPVRRETLVGWTAHYLVGIGFAAMLPAIWGATWIQDPTIGPALLPWVRQVVGRLAA